jgi:hypothetical protein
LVERASVTLAHVGEVVCIHEPLVHR